MAYLTTHEAIELLGALTGHLNGVLAVNALVIKGPVLAEQGLRDPRNSADLDILVAPSSAERLLDALRELGWRERGENWVHDRLGTHSVTLVHSGWPCDIDVHLVYPGLFAPANIAFDALWEDRGTVRMGGIEVPCTGRAGSVIVLALHSLRQAWDPSRMREFADLVERIRLDRSLQQSVTRLAVETGSARSLAPLFEALDLSQPPDRFASTADIARWARVGLHVSRSAQWFDYLRHLPLRKHWVSCASFSGHHLST